MIIGSIGWWSVLKTIVDLITDFVAVSWLDQNIWSNNVCGRIFVCSSWSNNVGGRIFWSNNVGGKISWIFGSNNNVGGCILDCSSWLWYDF